MPIRIAYVIDDLTYGGAQKQLSLLVRALPSPYAPVVVSMSRNLHPFADTIQERGIQVISLSRRTNNDIGRLYSLGRALKNTGADLIHGFLDAANVYAYLAGRSLGTPVMLSLRNDRLRLAGIRARVLSWTLRHADGVLVNSRAGRDLLVREIRVNPGRVSYIPNWTEDNPADDTRPVTSGGDAKIVGCIARFAPQKQLHLLVDAFGRAHEQIPDSKLVLMGSGDGKEALARRVQRLGIDRWVEFLEPRLDVTGVLKRFHCFVLSSHHEGLPNAAIEALAAGVPIIATPSGDVADLVVEGKTGILVTEAGAGSLAAAIISVLGDSDLREKARIFGPELVRRHFSMSAALDRLLPVYGSLTTR